MRQTLKQNLYDIFGMDVRSLALLRVSLALVLITGWAYRAFSLAAMYSDSGVLPRDAAIKFAGNPWYVSINMISGQWQIQAALFAAAFIFGLFLLAGYKTRLSAVISWLLLISVQNRNPIILSNADVALRLLLFWAMFLPLGEVFSVDAVKRGSAKTYRRISAATVGYFLQFISIYFFAALLKSAPAWHSQGSAVYYALSSGVFAGKWAWLLLRHPGLTRFLTHSVWWFELLGTLLLIFPVFTIPLRIAGIFGFMVLQLGIGFFMHLGMFPLNVIVFGFALLPEYFWQILGRFKQPGGKLSVYYDGRCGTCKKLADGIAVFFLVPDLEVLPAEANSQAAEIMRANNSWVVKDSRGVYFKFDGVVRALKASRLFWPLGFVLDNRICKKTGDKFYDYVAGHRKIACELPLVPAHRSGIFSSRPLSALYNMAGVFLITVTLLYNVSGLPRALYRFPTSLYPVVNFLRLDQRWDMFDALPCNRRRLVCNFREFNQWAYC